MDNLVRLLRSLIVDHGALMLAPLLGGLAVYLLLPRPGASRRWLGALLAAGALVYTGAFVIRVGAVTPETLLFYAFSGIALLAGGMLVTQSNPARAALSFALVVLSTCGLFLLLAAPFLMAATIIIYAGAIIVIFLFVLMLAHQEGVSDADQRSREPVLACTSAFLLLAALLYLLHQSYSPASLDGLMAKVRQAKEEPSIDGMARSLGSDSEFNTAFFEAFRSEAAKGGGGEAARSLVESVENAQAAWVAARGRGDVVAARRALEEVEAVGLRTRSSLSALQPPTNAPLSSLSGPPANLPLHVVPDEGTTTALRRDAATSRPELPADNTAYLGRALFTDYLLAVELGGTLLLVATIGAIALAARREKPA